MLNNKRGQVGETITWIIATIVIVVLLLFFIFGASMLGTIKSVDVVKNSVFSTSESYGEDLFLKKSIYTYLIVPSEGAKQRLERFFMDSYGENYKPLLKELEGRYKK